MCVFRLGRPLSAGLGSGESFIAAPKAEIMADLYGWPLDEDGNSNSHKFQRDEIGLKQYQSAHASVSRACRRLVESGLLKEWRWINHTGVSLNRSGQTGSGQVKRIARVRLG